MKFKYLLVSLFLVFGTFAATAQEKKNFELEDLYQRGTFYAKSVRGMNSMKDGKTYASFEKGQLNIYNYQSGKLEKTLFGISDLTVHPDSLPIGLQNYELSQNEDKMLCLTDMESIYRHSFHANYYVYDFNAKTLQPLSNNGKQRLATFSPDATKVAFMRDNNLFIKDLTTGEEKQFTNDGLYNHIINGAPDWVYEEEFSFSQGFYWSPDSKKIAFMKFDESNVREFQMEEFEGLYPDWYSFKYPKAGEDNSIVGIYVYDLASGKTVKMDTGTETDIYLPRIAWTKDANVLAIQRLNRHQNHLEILAADATTGKSRVFYDETNEYYIDITDDWHFLEDGKRFLMTSERSGYNHIYLYNMDGTLVKQLTDGPWDVTSVYGFDGKEVYFQAAKNTPVDRQIYAVNLKGKMREVIGRPGTNNARFSNDFSYLININSSITQPAQYELYTNKGKLVRVLEDNHEFAEKLKTFNLGEKKLMKISDPAFTLPDGQQVDIDAWQILPPDFDPSKKYPVLIYVYGGPGHQTVLNSWANSDYWWLQLLAQHGIISVSINNRGSGAQGEVFKKMTYLQLGKYETEDMITLAKYMAKQPYVDGDRIGIYGWSYGGFMAANGITKGAEVISTAVSVAPVTNWRYYDNIYTERFLQKPQDNPSGYDDNSPCTHAAEMNGKYLLVHGTGDDNVHFQNSMDLVTKLNVAEKQYEQFFYPNKNHFIYGGNTRFQLYTKLTNFLLENL